MLVGEKRKVSGLMLILMSFILAICMILSGGIRVSADVTTVKEYSEAVSTLARAEMTGTYGTSGGGTYKVVDLLVLDAATNIYKIDEVKYGQLTSAAQTQFLTDLDAVAQKVIATDTTGAYTDESQTNWYQILQQQPGVGSKMLNVILANTKPDFVTANRIYKPFSGLVGTVLGLGAVLIMAFLGIVMVCDISYITLPPVRLFVGDDDNKKNVKSKLFSHDAIYAVRVAEDNDKGDGSPKQALGIYFKRRVIMLIILGICLMYLIQGEIYTLVGRILDLVSGFFG